MAKKHVCDFCLAEPKGFFAHHDRLRDGHYICKNCASIIQHYKLPLEYDLFQKLVVADPKMTDMMMDAWLENNDAQEALNKYYFYPGLSLHDEEICINAMPAYMIVKNKDIPYETAVKDIRRVSKRTYHNVPSAEDSVGTTRVNGMLYETQIAVYFMTEHFVNCLRPGYMIKRREETDRITMATPSRIYVYYVDHADLFYLREAFFHKAQRVLAKKDQNLIYLSNTNEYLITPGVYEIPNTLQPGIYNVTAVNGSGLHIRDALGRSVDFDDSYTAIDLSEGSFLEVTGEYRLQWIASNNDYEENDDDDIL